MPCALADDVSFDSDLAGAVNSFLEPNSAVLFSPDEGTFSGRMFAVVDSNGDGEYQAGQDFVLEMAAPVVPLDPPVRYFV